MRTDNIHSINYLFPVIKDDYGNDLWLAFINSRKEFKTHPTCGYIIVSKNVENYRDFSAYTEEAYWKAKERALLLIEKEGFYIEEYMERMHSLEWNPKPITGYQSPAVLGLVTRFYVRKNLQE